MSDHILVEQDGPIATVVFNRPKMRNAISLAMWSEIAMVTERLSKDDSVRAIVYRGAGTDAFASGADISEFQENRKDTATALNYNKQTEAAYSAIRVCPKPTVAMVFGYCMGGAMALAMAADLRFAAAGSKFGIPAARLSIIYGLDPVHQLVDLVGPAYAKDILYSLSVRGTKAQVQAIFDGITDAHRDHLRNLGIATFDSEDYREGTRAFLEKRAPRFQGR
jgi:enoyl-CoA hydratase/carnithine racemase